MWSVALKFNRWSRWDFKRHFHTRHSRLIKGGIVRIFCPWVCTHTIRGRVHSGRIKPLQRNQPQTSLSFWSVLIIHWKKCIPSVSSQSVPNKCTFQGLPETTVKSQVMHTQALPDGPTITGVSLPISSRYWVVLHPIPYVLLLHSVRV